MNFVLKNKVCKALSVFLLVALAFTLCLPVSAETYPTEAYDTYTYWAGPDETYPVSTTPIYEYKDVITGDSLGVGAFNEPQDVYTDKNGNIYIADTGNGRVVVVTPDYKLKTTLKDLKYKGETLNMEGLSGVYVHSNGDIYICDTKNERIIITTIEGAVKDVLTLPDDDVIPDTFTYLPTRVVVDSDGITYVISEGSYYGAVMYDATGKFTGFFGANSVQGTFLTVLTRIKELIFRNDQKKAQEVKDLPYQFNDIAMDENNFVYTATGAVSTWVSKTGQLRKLSPGGSNVLKDKTGKEITSSDSFNFSDGGGIRFADKGGLFGHRVTDLRSLDVDEYGYMYGLCRVYGHIFLYDQDCNLLGAFGGGLSEGYQKGTFNSPQSIRYDKTTRDVLMVDKLAGNVTVYKETEFGALFKQAQQLTYAGAYTESKPLWEKVISQDRNCQLAYVGLAKAAYIEGDYESAMTYAKNGFDQDTYANAFTFVRNEWLSQNFVLIFLIALVLVGGLIAVLVISRKKKLTLIKHEPTKVMFGTMLHPFDSFKAIKYQQKGSILLATIVMVLYFVSTLAMDMYSGFMHVLFNKSTYNATYTFIMTVGLIGLFSIANWGMATLFEGKGTFKEVYITTCYAFLPQVIYNVFYAVFSNVFTPEEGLILTVVNVICLALSIIILCVGMMEIHEFGMLKFVGIMIITVLAMAVVVFVAFMVGILITQMITFIGTIIQEIRYRQEVSK